MPFEITPESFERFVQERRYLYNVSPNTETIYRNAWANWLKYGPEPLGFVRGMREAGKNAIGCNMHIRSLNAFFRWAGQPTMKRLKEEDKIPPTFGAADVQRLIRYKPERTEQREHLLAMTLLDSGLRINEALSLQKVDVDLDAMLFLVRGKGRKERYVPFSFELRKRLWRHLSDHPHALIFCTREGRKLQRRNVLRNVKELCIAANVKPPCRLLHSFRHTFAVNYLRNGGSVFHLQRALGHSSLQMSRRYANLTTEDLASMQQKVSLLHVAR